MLTFKKFSEANLQRCNESFRPIQEWSPNDWATAMAGECGEACNVAKKMRRLFEKPEVAQYYRMIKPLKYSHKEEISQYEYLRGELARELADVITYVDLFATRMGINLEDALISKFNEVSDRVYSTIKLTRESDGNH